MNSKVHSFFNETENYLHRSFGVRLRAEIVRDFVGNLNNLQILDAGCGDGGVSLQFLKDNQITFCDLSENMLQRVAVQIPTELMSHSKFVNCPIADFNSDNKFDYIFCIGVLAHVPSVSLCIAHLAKQLNPNGSLIVQFSDYRHWLTKLSVSLAGYDYSVNKIRYKELEQIIYQLNFNIVQRVQYNFMLPGMGKLPDSLLYNLQRATLKFKFLRLIGTEHVWMLKKNPE